VVRSTWKSSAIEIAYSNNAVLPMPASPSNTIAPPCPSRADDSSRSSTSQSTRRPNSMRCGTSSLGLCAARLRQDLQELRSRVDAELDEHLAKVVLDRVRT